MQELKSATPGLFFARYLGTKLSAGAEICNTLRYVILSVDDPQQQSSVQELESANLDVEFLSITPPTNPGEPYTIAVRIIDREDEAADTDPDD